MEQIKASYGWDRPSTTLLKGETAWSFDVTFLFPTVHTEVGWGSLMLNDRDGEDEDAALVVGVFPEFQRKGLRTAILDWMCFKAHALGAHTASMIVYKSNEAHYKRTM